MKKITHAYNIQRTKKYSEKEKELSYHVCMHELLVLCDGCYYVVAMRCEVVGAVSSFCCLLVLFCCLLVLFCYLLVYHLRKCLFCSVNSKVKMELMHAASTSV